MTDPVDSLLTLELLEPPEELDSLVRERALPRLIASSTPRKWRRCNARSETDALGPFALFRRAIR